MGHDKSVAPETLLIVSADAETAAAKDIRQKPGASSPGWSRLSMITCVAKQAAKPVQATLS